MVYNPPDAEWFITPHDAEWFITHPDAEWFITPLWTFLGSHSPLAPNLNSFSSNQQQKL